jgi:general stress protein 26
MDDRVEKLKQVVGRCRVGMLGVHSDDGMHFTPMSHVDVDDDGNLWFFTSKESGKSVTVNNKGNIHLTYAQEANNTFLSIEGTAQLIGNKEKMRELFNPYLRAWFPKGLDDPSISLLVVHPLEVEYWTNDERKVLTHSKIFSSDSPEEKHSQNGNQH